MLLRWMIAPVMAASLLLAACGGDSPDRDPAAEVSASDPGPTHVHGLGVNPADGALFVATHTGLFRAAPGEQTATRVGDLYQDTMGFTIVGPDRFLGSGHPDLRTEQPPYLGLISSKDAGESWQPVSLQGEVDFHVLEATGRRVVGYGSDFTTRRPVLAVSDDGGRSWKRRPDPPALVSMAISPEDPDTWVASTPGELLRSTDAGRSWQRQSGRPGLLSFAGRRLHAVGLDGTTAVSSDGGRSWRQVGEIGGEPAAFEATTDGVLAALHDGTIKQSPDGRRWVVRSRPQAAGTGG